MADARLDTLYARLRAPSSASTVPGSLPVLFFGDLFGAEVATVGLNPSDQEYLSRSGEFLAGDAKRFATLASLGASDRASLADAQCDEAIDWMRAYYDAGKPVYGSWFNALTRVVEGFGASFRDRSACHLDLIQEATNPVWSKLPATEQEALLERDLPFLEWEICAYPLRAVICTGKTVGVNVRRLLAVEVEEVGTLARIKWWVGRADVAGRQVGFAGWNYPLARATGLGAAGETELGQLLAAKLGRLGHRQPTNPQGGEAASELAEPSPGDSPAAASSAAAGSRVKGLTHPVWDGVPLPKLRYWLRWWQDETKSAGRVEAGWGREEQIVRLKAEIAAREAARTQRPANEAEAMADPDPIVSEAERRHSLYRDSATRDDLFALVESRREAIRDYLEWAKENDNGQWTFRMDERPDIRRAAKATALFPDAWWGVVVYSCFDSVAGATVVAPPFQRPLPPPEAEAVLGGMDFPRGSIGGHRIQPAVKGARQALVAACADHELFREVLHSREDFDTRYLRLRAARMRQWGRTTCFDLLLRAGALGVGGAGYAPDYAYLGGSTGPSRGFARVFGEAITNDERVAWAESLLWAWREEWSEVAERVGVDWQRPPLEPRDQENFLCIYQER